MRNITTKLMALLLAVFSLQANAAETPWIPVSTADEFISAINNSRSSKVLLTADIDLKDHMGSGKYLFEGTFKGKILGSIPEGSDRIFCFSLMNATKPLFEEVVDAEFTDLLFANCSFSGLDTRSGVITSYTRNSSYSNITFGNCHGVGDSNTYDCDRMGMVAGLASDCSFQDLAFMDCSIITDGSYIGMVTGQAQACSFKNCISNFGCELWADGNFTSDNSAYVGGICGKAERLNNTACTFESCYNFGIVSSDDDRIGGIVGYCNGTQILDCKNGGIVRHCTRAGFGRDTRQTVAYWMLGIGVSSTVLAFASWGLMQYLLNGQNGLTSYDTFKDLFGHTYYSDRPWGIAFGFYSYRDVFLTKPLRNLAGQVIAKLPVLFAVAAAVSITGYYALSIYDLASQPDEIGGIVGIAVNDSYILRCANHGPVECKDVECGGIVGRMEGSTVESCYNRSMVKGGTKYTGGIAGRCLANSQLNYNLNVGPISSMGSKVAVICPDIDNSTAANNFYLSDKDEDNQFSQAKLPTGEIALRLNTLLADAGKDPVWRQDIGEGKDFYPTLEANGDKPIVTAANTSITDLWQNVSTASEFYLAAANPLAKIRLTDDIDLNSFYIGLSSEQIPFKGEIDGQGHAIKNMNIEIPYDEYDMKNYAALFPYANDAKFRNLIIDNFSFSQQNKTLSVNSYESFLVASSNNCLYENIKVRNSNILRNEDPDYLYGVAALVAESNSDNFKDCTIEGSCRFEGYIGMKVLGSANVGGVAAIAEKSVFCYCHNRATLWADDNRVGGIVGQAKNCGFENCLNTGYVTGRKYVGGIVGYAEAATQIYNCVNTGEISGDQDDCDHIAGIVGFLTGSGSSIDYCVNFGNVTRTNSTGGGIDGGLDDGATYETDGEFHCKYYYNFNGTLSNNIELEDITSGKFAFTYEGADSKAFLYQSIDNEPFCTSLPVPVAAAGTVYKNIDCSGNVTYSNKYQSTQSHTPQDVEMYGFCTICGKVSTAPTEFNVKDANDLVALSYATNRGLAYSQINILNDIDMTGVTDFMPIGNRRHPFHGKVLGNHHRIRNLTINHAGYDEGIGLFGIAEGVAYIHGLVLDSTCCINAQGSNYVGGIVGCLRADDETSNSYLTLNECGNEASVNGADFVAGLFGGIPTTGSYSLIDQEQRLKVLDSYNTGTVQGLSDCAAVAAWGGNNVKMKGCYNLGTVTGTKYNHSMIYYNDDYKKSEFDNNFQYSSLAADSLATPIDLPSIINGGLLNGLLSKSEAHIWTQNLGTDAYPVLSQSKTPLYCHHERVMTNSWGTAVMPFDITADEGARNCELYSITSCNLTGTDGCITLSKVEGTLSANTPFFIKRTGAASDTVSLRQTTADLYHAPESSAYYVSNPIDNTQLSLIGNYLPLAGVTDIYYLADNKMWYAEQEVSIPAFRAFLTGSQQSSAPARSIAIRLRSDDGTSTQIGEIRDGEFLFFDDAPTYNLQGQRIAAHTKGLQVRGGRKVVVR